MTTTADMIQETRSHLQANMRDELNRLNGSMTNSTTSAVVEFAQGGIQRGSILGVELEVMYVWSFATQTATVQRGFMGSTAATHADDTLVYVNPRWTDFHILRALNAELASYSSPRNGLYRVRTVDLTYSSSAQEYDLTSVTDLVSVLGVTSSMPGVTDWYPVSSWSLSRDLPTTTFPSGKALSIYTPVTPGRTVRVVYGAPFVSLSALDNDVAAVSFLPATAHDIPPLGAAARLLAGREAARAQIDAQPESRNAEEVQAGANRGAAGGLLALRDMRLREEAARLRVAYPHMRRAS